MTAERFGVPEHFADYREVIARDDIDVVLVATPIPAHAAVATAAAAAGKHVYVQKTMTVTVAEADDLRKAIGKKDHKLMASLEGKFLEGTAGSGVAAEVARGLWSDMEKAQDYSFNKSHAACYALIAYRTAYLKAHHTAQYMAALISSVMNTKDRVPYYVNACDEMGIDVLPPDVNASQVDFAVVEGKIRFGLNAVLAFWLAYILTRPLGASIGDWLSQPPHNGGLGLGATNTSYVFLACILALVSWLTVTKRDRTPPELAAA